MTPWNLKNLQMTCIFKAMTIQKGKISSQSSEAWENQCHITFFGLRISFIYMGSVYIPQSKDIHNFHFCRSLGRSVEARTSDRWFFSTHWTLAEASQTLKWHTFIAVRSEESWSMLLESLLIYFLNGALPSSSNNQSVEQIRSQKRVFLFARKDS